jgi:hypothetical protein
MQNKYFPTNSMMEKSSTFFILVNLHKANKNMLKPKDLFFSYQHYYYYYTYYIYGI